MGGFAAREQARAAIVKMLGIRFGEEADAIEVELRSIDDGNRLDDLFDHAAECRDLAAFRKQLSS